jgi:hypothetical protein
MPRSKKSSEDVAGEARRCSFPFRLGDLPPEIRILIFTEYLKWSIQRDTTMARRFEKDKGSKTPELIKALRPDQKMYTEALDVLFDLSIFTISSNNHVIFKYMTRQTLERVRILEIWYGYVVSLPSQEPFSNTWQSDSRSAIGPGNWNSCLAFRSVSCFAALTSAKYV